MPGFRCQGSQTPHAPRGLFGRRHQGHGVFADAPQPALKNLILAPYFGKLLNKASGSLRRVVRTATDLGTPIPAYSNTLAYFDAYRSRRLPANLLQAQRDYFGAHTYRRIDKEGTFHTQWDK